MYEWLCIFIQIVSVEGKDVITIFRALHCNTIFMYCTVSVVVFEALGSLLAVEEQHTILFALK